MNLYDMFSDLENSYKAGLDYPRTILVDIVEDDLGYELVASLPNLKKENIMLEYQNDKLAISVKKEEAKETGKYLLHERGNKYYARILEIPSIEGDKITAKYENGNLIVSLPKEKKETKNIIVQ